MDYRPDTKFIHGGTREEPYHGSLSTPIFQTSTFTFPDAEEGALRFSGEKGGYIYSRLSNPTVKVFEEKVAVAEGAEMGLAFASGMAAISAVFTSLTSTGDHMICSNGIYGCTFGLLKLLKEKYQISHDFCDMRNEQQLRSMIQPNTKCLFIESPANPTMKLIDLARTADIAHEYGIKVVVDNTFSSPYLQQPLRLGCDIVVHSATKYLSGHGDVIGGVVAGSRSYIQELAQTAQKDYGGIMAPMDAWLLIRGMKTLPIRMDRHSSNAVNIVEKLKQHPRVEKVNYPTDKDHPDSSFAHKQMSQGGGVLSFQLKGDKGDAQQLMNQLKLVRIAVSLGDAETLIQHPATMTHSLIPAEDREAMDINDSLLRLSVGLEAWQDIWFDLLQALEGCAHKR
ncbi:methionine gamma-lyase [Halobacillus sp. A1]|uniref:methionine gamma-lyase n=1 Tax=Halobacillus sp. A1 TaxID=2880262 RepID=UPI0020A61E4A|nr:methionine gamma-lyase [Halobacillus sp. A1]MCP3031034.1 methionine gamma-lyase [Halobacillus sp. A1]